MVTVFARILEIIGEYYDALKGPSTTSVYPGQSRNEIYRISPNDAEGATFQIGFESRQIVYHTHYRRWWVPDERHSLFEVIGTAPMDVRPHIDPRLLDPVTYPMLCNRLLQWSRYPHVLAILAYLDRVQMALQPYRVSL